MLQIIQAKRTTKEKGLASPGARKGKIKQRLFLIDGLGKSLRRSH